MRRAELFAEALRPLPSEGYCATCGTFRCRPSRCIGWIALCCWTGATFAAGVLAGAVWVTR